MTADRRRIGLNDFDGYVEAEHVLWELVKAFANALDDSDPQRQLAGIRFVVAKHEEAFARLRAWVAEGRAARATRLERTHQTLRKKTDLSAGEAGRYKPSTRKRRRKASRAARSDDRRMT